MSESAQDRRARGEGAFEATSALMKLNVDRSKPIDIFSIIQKQEIWLVFGPLGNAYGMFLKKDVRGIFINSQRPPSVQRLTAAHEFGHAWLGHEPSIDGHDDIEALRISVEQEAAAQGFALDFLMPLDLVESLWDTLKLPTGSDLTARQAYILALTAGLSYRACVVQLRQMEKITRQKASQFLSVQPKQLKREIGGGIGPADPWADVWPLEASDSGRYLEVRINDEIRICLGETPSTGYRWCMEAPFPEKADLVGDEFEGLGGPEAIGAGGHRYFAFRAAVPGRDSVRLGLRQPWIEGDPDEVFGLSLKVDPGPAGENGVGLPVGLLEAYLAEAK